MSDYQNTVPIQFIDEIKGPQHILLLYEELEWARIIEFRFILNGLEKGEHCIYTTHNDIEHIETEMKSNGIAVEKYKESGLLRIKKIPTNPIRPTDLKGSLKLLFDSMSENTTEPYRIVIRCIKGLDKKEKITIQVHLEEIFHDIFVGGNMILCPYPINEIENSNFMSWIRRLVQSHHSTVIATSFGNGTAFYK